MRSVYLIGPPGAGKTSVMAELTRPWGLPEVVVTPVPHLRWGGTVEVGRRRGEFSGTDALGYAVVPSAVAWVTGEQRPDVLLGEGDRLACGAFFDALRLVGHLTVVSLEAPPDLSYQRMWDRAARLGRPLQNEAWWRGRVTKCMNLAVAYHAVRLDASAPVGLLARQVEVILTQE